MPVYLKKRIDTPPPDRHVIDSDDETLFSPMSSRLVQHIGRGNLEWNLDNIDLYFPDRQDGDTPFDGHSLLKELDGQPVLNACFVSFLWRNPRLAAELIRKAGVKSVLFWGSIFETTGGLWVKSGKLFVPFIGQSNPDIYWSFYYLDEDFRGKGPAAILKV
jgi:hypothetical protein